MSAAVSDRLRDRLGVCQWFHYEAYADVERAITQLRALQCRRLRTGISWADFHRPRGQRWYEWQMAALAEFDVLLSVWHTPPSLAEGGTCASPPRRLDDYAAFIAQVIELYGDRFDALELWNEPNNRYKWDFVTYDPKWRKFATMVGLAARVAAAAGKQTVLGGMIPIDRHWLELIAAHGGLEHIDVVAIHGFPGMWWNDAPNWDWHTHWTGWADKIADLGGAVERRPIWITETGLSTWDLDRAEPGRFAAQVARLNELAAAPAERIYWYSLIDLDPRRPAIEGFHVDENEYHLGLVDHAGARKPAWYRMRELLRGEPIEPFMATANPAPTRTRSPG